MTARPPLVAIDGPAGSGKSTVAAGVAARLGVPHHDTGALYRAATLACLRAGVDLEDGAACRAVAEQAQIDRRDGRTWLEGDDVEAEIRGDEVTAAVSTVAAHPEVRKALEPLQREMADRVGGVMEGRDIGTVVLPHADVKIFLTASVDERARRRAEQLGIADHTELIEDIQRRDRLDATRATSPLREAEDAVRIDTTEMSLDEVIDEVVHQVERPRVATDPLSARRALPRVAVVGRPNVGKSTLVNRILGARIAIVEEKPGVTRDRTEHLAEWAGRTFVLVDTGGWEHGATGLAARIVEQAEAAAATADLVLFVVDATVGIQENDERYARSLRRAEVPVVLVANKVDSPRHEPAIHELHGLGLGEPHPVSARHGRGTGDLLDVVVGELPPVADEVADAAAMPGIPRVAIVGKPNVGKSSLYNRLLGEERAIVHAEPHTTRDAVDSVVTLDGAPWVFVDTAGLRRHYRRGEDTELYSVDRTRRAVEDADLALFVVDASQPVSEQDQRLAAMIRDSGRGVVLVLNKWDLVDEDRRYDLERELDRLLGFARWVPRVNVSALTGRGIRRLPGQLAEVWDAYRTRIPTRELNEVLREAVERSAPPPTTRDRTLRLRYMTQPEVAPPLFVVFANGPIPAAYRRYLERFLRERYGFPGVPLRIEDR